MDNKRKPQRVYQHEPLITPSGWSWDERQLVIRLTQILDDVYQKYGALEARVKELEGKNSASV